MGADELRPLARSGSSSLGGIGGSVLDAMSTLALMGLSDEVARASAWVRANFSFDAGPRAYERDEPGTESFVGVFETAIRGVGGLLSAAQLTGDGELGAAAARLAARLLPAFDTPTGLPHGWVQLVNGSARSPGRCPACHAVLSEYASLTVEFLSLSASPWGDPRFGALAEQALAAALAAPNRPVGRARGLLPTLVSPWTGLFLNHRLSLGGGGDSAYEYLLKAWLLSGRSPAHAPYVRLFDAAVDSAVALLARRSPGRAGRPGLLFVGELVVPNTTAPQPAAAAAPAATQGDGGGGGSGGGGGASGGGAGGGPGGAAGAGARFPPGAPVDPEPRMEHLVCFLPGALVLAAEGARAERYLRLAGDLAETCWQMYAQSPSGLAPDAATFQRAAAAASATASAAPPGSDISVADGGDARHQLRPEALESLFYLWRATGDAVHRDRGWAIFAALRARCAQPGGGYAGLLDVRKPSGGGTDDVQPSWFLAETLKYAWLLFSPSSALDLNQWVLSTEGHPLRVAPLPDSLLFGLTADQLVRGAAQGPGAQEPPWVAQGWDAVLAGGAAAAGGRGAVAGRGRDGGGSTEALLRR